MIDGQNPYSNREVFCVSRDPYSRAVSEYLWVRSRHEHGHLGTKAKGTHALDACPGCTILEKCSAEGLNHFLQKVLQLVQKGSAFVNRCHMLPQSRYIWRKD